MLRDNTAKESVDVGFPQGWGPYEEASVVYRLTKQMELLDEIRAGAQGLLLVDVGIGKGFYLGSYFRRGFRVVGVDLNHENLEQVRGFFIGSSDLWPVRANARALPIKDESADIAVMCQTLEHLINPIQALSEAYRILRSGGYLLVDVPWMHEFYRPLSFVFLRLLQATRENDGIPFVLRPWMRVQDGTVNLRPWARYPARLLELLPAFRGIKVESFVNAYRSGQIAEGDLHLHAYYPTEWLKLITSAGFNVHRTAGAWLAPPPFNRWRRSNEAFEWLRRLLPDEIASRVCQKLVIVARKP
jgi:ubiquinone/menaquinone biosynthesis C-methylase UbiE